MRPRCAYTRIGKFSADRDAVIASGRELYEGERHGT